MSDAAFIPDRVRLVRIAFAPYAPEVKAAMSLLRSSIEGSEQSEVDVVLRLESGAAVLWVLREGDRTVGALVTSQEGRSLFVMHLAADSFDQMASCWNEVEQYARSVGAAKLRGRCSPAAARIFNRKIGSRTAYCVVEQSL